MRFKNAEVKLEIHKLLNYFSFDRILKKYVLTWNICILKNKNGQKIFWF